MVMLRRLLFGFAVFGFATFASAQWAPKGNPVADAALNIVATGIKPSARPAKVTTGFKPSGKTKAFLDAFISKTFSSTEERDGFRPVYDKVFEEFPRTMKPSGLDNDVAAAYAFATTTILTVVKKSEFDDKAFEKVVYEFQAALADACAKATDAQKEEAYNFAIASICTYLAYATAGADEAKLAPLGQALLLSLIGAQPDKISLDKDGITIEGKPSDPGPRTTSTGKVAVSYSLPQGWRKDDKSSWFVCEYRDPRYGNNADATIANLRFLPSIPAQGNFSDTLRKIWKEAVPPEFAEKASGMVYRKLIGNGLVSQFIYGVANENGKTWPTLFAVYLIDCGAVWQPVVVANAWGPTEKFPVGGEMSAKYSFPQSSGMIEEFFKTIQLPGAKPKNIVDKEALVGAFNFGTSSSMDYVNIYTGATVASTFVSYGGTLTLHSDGTFDYSYSSASGQVGAAKFGKIVGKGRWTLEGDILTTKYSLYDQGDSYHRELDRYRVAAAVTFTDGERGLVLMDIKKVANPTTIGASEEFYTTKKKQ